MDNKTNIGKNAQTLRARLVAKGAGGAGEFIRKTFGAGKPAATSTTMGKGPPPKGF